MGFAASSPCTWRARSGVTAWDFLYTVSGWLSFRGEFITFLIDKNFSNSGEAISEYHEKTHCKTVRTSHSTVHNPDYFCISSSTKVTEDSGRSRVQATHLACSYTPSCLCLSSLFTFLAPQKPSFGTGWLILFNSPSIQTCLSSSLAQAHCPWRKAPLPPSHSGEQSHRCRLCTAIA